MQTDQPRLSRYLQAGSPTRCQLPACQTPFDGTCYYGSDGKFYCSHECTNQGERERPSATIEPFRPRSK